MEFNTKVTQPYLWPGQTGVFIRVSPGVSRFQLGELFVQNISNTPSFLGCFCRCGLVRASRGHRASSFRVVWVYCVICHVMKRLLGEGSRDWVRVTCDDTLRHMQHRSQRRLASRTSSRRVGSSCWYDNQSAPRGANSWWHEHWRLNQNSGAHTHSPLFTFHATVVIGIIVCGTDQLMCI